MRDSKCCQLLAPTDGVPNEHPQHMRTHDSIDGQVDRLANPPKSNALTFGSEARRNSCGRATVAARHGAPRTRHTASRAPARHARARACVVCLSVSAPRQRSPWVRGVHECLGNVVLGLPTISDIVSPGRTGSSPHFGSATQGRGVGGSNLPGRAMRQ